MLKKRPKLIWILMVSGLFVSFLRLVAQDGDFVEARIFKAELEVPKVLERTAMCSRYLKTLKRMIYPHDNSTEIEFDFKEDSDIPARLAFSFVVHDQPGLFEVLLHLMFRPYHAYCIYIDAKTTGVIKEAFENIVNCYQEIFPWTNIFLIRHPHSISWGTYSLLDADLTCLKELMKIDSHWSYYMNLAGTELPLEDVDHFAKKLGTSEINFSIFSFVEPTLKEDRLKYAIEEVPHSLPPSRSFTHIFDSNKYHRYHSYEKTTKLMSPVPFNLTVYKGWKNVILSRDFSNFVLTHPVAQTFLNWTKDIEIPDEEFFPTLARITRISRDANLNYKITQNHVKEVPPKKGLCPRITLWSTEEENYQCDGATIRDICHLSQEDLTRVFEKNTLKSGDQDCFVANKFNLEVDPRPILSLARYLSPFVVAHRGSTVVVQEE